MGRKENKRAATAYRIDAADLARASFAQAALEATEPPRPTVSFMPVPAAAARATPASRVGQATQPATGRGALEAFTGKEKTRRAGAAAKTLRGVSSTAANVLGGLASLFEGLFGGARTPEQVEQAKFEERTATATPAATSAATPATSAGPQPAATSRHEDEVEAFLARERHERAAMQALRRAEGHTAISETQEIGNKKDRDRGGGQSL
jgi:hypothetical protein